ncbi:MAG: AbrB/MazE/SpoVT family DNA-binding domain-containing protein [Patescibacteria group bacterium]
MKQTNANFQEAWLRILGKGMVTLPKKWREELGVTTGDIIKAKKEGTKVVIETQQVQSVPYRIYTDSEIDDFLKEDRLSRKLARKVKNHLSELLTP